MSRARYAMPLRGRLSDHGQSGNGNGPSPRDAMGPLSILPSMVPRKLPGATPEERLAAARAHLREMGLAMSRDAID